MLSAVQTSRLQSWRKLQAKPRMQCGPPGFSHEVGNKRGFECSVGLQARAWSEKTGDALSAMKASRGSLTYQ
jgi:hypothetical protein